MHRSSIGRVGPGGRRTDGEIMTVKEIRGRNVRWNWKAGAAIAASQLSPEERRCCCRRRCFAKLMEKYGRWSLDGLKDLVIRNRHADWRTSVWGCRLFTGVNSLSLWWGHLCGRWHVCPCIGENFFFKGQISIHLSFIGTRKRFRLNMVSAGELFFFPSALRGSALSLNELLMGLNGTASTDFRIFFFGPLHRSIRSAPLDADERNTNVGARPDINWSACLLA